MNRLRTPEAGCFVANYPKPTWQPTQCATASSEPENVGNGHDYAAAVPSGQLIGSSTGSFPYVSGLTSEYDSKRGADWYSLQINSNSVASFPVTGFGVSGLTGWEQFIYANSPSRGHVFIEYWVTPYFNKTGHCPSQVPPGGGSGWKVGGQSCLFNTSGVFTPSVPPKNLNQLTLTAGASAQRDYVVVCIFATCYTSEVSTSFLGLYKHWNQSEFNVFGSAGSEAVFNSGTTIVVKNYVLNSSLAPFASSVVCLLGRSKGESTGMTEEPFSGETNNLNLGSCSPATATGVSSFCGCLSAGTSNVTEIVFTESD